MHGFRLPSANVEPNRPGSSFERPLLAPAPDAAELWLWLAAAATHLHDTRAIRAGVGTGFAQRPAETLGLEGASGAARDQKCREEM